MEINLQIGPALRADGDVEDRLRVGRQGALITADGHGRYYEAASRGWVYSAVSSLAGAALVAANAAPPAAAAAVFFAVWNPPGSGVNLEILRAYLAHISGTPAAGQWAYCLSPQQSISAAQNIVPRAHLNGAPGAKGQAYSQTALTGGAVFTTTRPFPSAQFAAAIAATTPNLSVKDDVDSDIVVPPGYALVVAPPGAGTTHVCAGGLTWAEVPVQTAG